MSKIVVCGSEDFTLGFELIGIDAYKIEDFEKLILNKEEIGIVVVSQRDYETFSPKLKTMINKLIKPIVVILSSDDLKGNNLREQVIRALGVDLLKK